MAATISPDEFKEALGRYPEVLKKNGKTPKEGLSIEELDKFRYQTAPMSFSKVTGRIMELSDVEKLVQWKIHHGAFRAMLPKLVATNTNESVAAAAKDAFAAYAKDNKDIATVISKLSALRGIGPATASLLLAIHDPQNVVFFSDEVFSYLTADGKAVGPKYTTKEFETIFAESQTVMSRLNCTPIELEKVAYVLIKEKAPEPKKARGRPALAESDKKPARIPSGKPRGRPTMTAAEKRANQSRRETDKAKAAKAVTNRTRTGRIVKKTPLLINESGIVITGTRAKASGRPKATKVASAAAFKAGNKRGRPAKVEEAEPKAAEKRGQPAEVEGPGAKPTVKAAGKKSVKSEKATAPKTVPATKVKEAAAPAKKRGRPARSGAVEVKTPKKAGRSVAPEAVTATPASKKRGRPSLAATAEDETKTPASKKRKTTVTPAPASSAKRGGRTPASAAASSVKTSGRKATT